MRERERERKSCVKYLDIDSSLILEFKDTKTMIIFHGNILCFMAHKKREIRGQKVTNTIVLSRFYIWIKNRFYIFHCHLGFKKWLYETQWHFNQLSRELYLSMLLYPGSISIFLSILLCLYLSPSLSLRFRSLFKRA